MRTKELPEGSCVKDGRYDFLYFNDCHHWYGHGKTFSFEEMDKLLEGPNYFVARIVNNQQEKSSLK